MSPYYPPQGGGGGSGTPGGSDSQIQVNSQNSFAGFSNLRWIGSSNSLDLNTAGRVRHGGVAEVDGIAPTGVTGLIWLDTSSTITANTISFPLSVASGGTALTSAGSALTILGVNSNGSTLEYKVLTAGSSINITYQNTGITINASTGGGSGAPQYKDWTYYAQIGSSQGSTFDRRVLAGINNCTVLSNLATPPINIANYLPLVITRSSQIDRISFKIITGSGNAVAQLGLYTNSQDTLLYPFQSIVTSGVIQGLSSSTTIELTVNQVLSQNTLYWLGLILGSNTVVSCNGVPVASAIPIFGSNSGMTGIGFGIAIAQQFSNGLPAIAQAGGSIIISPVPALAVRLSA